MYVTKTENCVFLIMIYESKFPYSEDLCLYQCICNLLKGTAIFQVLWIYICVQCDGCQIKKCLQVLEDTFY